MKGQGSLEYLIITAAVLAISAVVVLFITGAFGSIKADVSACKQAAATCKITMITTTNPSCSNCEIACKDPSGKDVMKDLGETCGPACILCKKGEATKIGASPGTPTELSPDTATAGLWHFNEGAGTTAADASGNGNVLTLTNNPVWVDGRFGKAIQLDGTNKYTRRSSGTNLPLGSMPRTFEAWIKPFGYPDSSYNGIIAYGQMAANKGSLLSIRNNGLLTMAFWNNDAYQASGPAATLNGWNHVVFTYAGGTTVKFYMNGEFVGEITLSASTPVSPGTLPATEDGPIRIGCTDDPGRCFNGIIDEVAIYNRAKTASEIYVDANY